MLDAIKSWMPLVIAVIAFVLGNTYGQARVHDEWTKSENAALEAYKAEAQKVIEAKDNEIKTLNNNIANLAKSRSDIVRKLDAYKNRERTLAECRDDRARMADVAERLDDYSYRLLTRTRSMIDGKSGQ